MIDPYGKTVAHSYSSLKMFENCPLNYEQQKILRTVPFKGSPEMEFGNRVHKDLELYLRNGKELTIDSEPYQPMVDTIRKMMGGLEFETEREFTINAKLKPTGWWDHDAWFRSKVDWLLFDEEKAYMWDWKTGKRRPDFFELEIFATMIFLHYPQINKIAGGFVWLKESGKNAIDREVYTRDKNYKPMLLDLLHKCKRVEDAIKQSIYPPRPSGLCGWCPCEPDCQFSSRKK